MLDKAISIAAQAFEGVHDKGGRPYILHCLHVMNRVKHLGDQAMIVAVLHDLIEDTAWTAEQLLKEGFDDRTVKLIVMVTRLEDEDYEKDYIPRVSLNPITREIKLADLRHNSDPMRMRGITPKDNDRLAKYFRAYNYLEEAGKSDAGEV